MLESLSENQHLERILLSSFKLKIFVVIYSRKLFCALNWVENLFWEINFLKANFLLFLHGCKIVFVLPWHFRKIWALKTTLATRKLRG